MSIVTTTRPCAIIKRTTLTNPSPDEGRHRDAVATTATTRTITTTATTAHRSTALSKR